MPPEREFELEDFWGDLLAYIEDGRVMPVVGAGLLTIQDGGQTVSLYRAVAERLLAKYKRFPLPEGWALRQHHELNDAVALLVGDGRRVKDLYRPIHDILQQLLAAQTEPL